MPITSQSYYVFINMYKSCSPGNYRSEGPVLSEEYNERSCFHEENLFKTVFLPLNKAIMRECEGILSR